ncbi:MULTISPECIES: efflux RND transporter periplasmic adaptor subunit [unclassified Sphingomonas]|uniref:efflux RND transporter periplasmic adaptor subunit n=1 Tax=unclassified Sphingomonas TaxID=196159 RepID=UPI000BC90432|nr:MAG: efflux transporter periplasmic adaptor subunit [Sphingomonas sp. 12-62-6]OYX37792.1 MAG: efflux transporter periplasmic adaptor subunit [Sphingomonas sp. 32-62-10]
MPAPNLPNRPSLALLALALSVLLAGCGSGGAQKGGKGPSGPPEVGYIVAQPGAVPVIANLSGRTNAYQTAEVRPQVSGIIRRRLFTEGSYVRAGQTLYEIDPSLYRAAGDEARANLMNAQANAEAARIKADRFKPLAEMQAVSAQEYTDALAQSRQAQAAIAQSRAQLATARINLRFTRVPAPITGRIGRSLFTQGALVTTNQAEPLSVIQKLDPIFVDIRQSSAELLTLRKALAQGDAAPTTANVTLKLEDGTDYGYTGTVEFTEVTVDPGTGTVTLRARFPNPQNLLLPGMFVRTVFAQAISTTAFLVPQRGLARDPRGNATVLIVGPGNKVVQRPVKAERTQGADWVVTDGLAPGDKVIVEGVVKAKPGTAVKPVPAGSPQRITARKGNGATSGPAR